MNQNAGTVRIGTLRGPNALLLIIGVIIALIALMVAIFGRASGPGTSSVSASVVQVSTAVSANSALVAGDLKLVTVPTNAIPPNPITSVKSAVGQFAAVNLNAGEILSTNLLLSASQEAHVGPLLNIPAGTVAMTVPAGGELNGVAGYPAPGDQLDLIVTTPPPGDMTKTVFTSLVILRVNGPDSGTTASGATSGNETSFTLAVPLAQAEQITWAFQNFSNWKWVLRSPSNYNQPQAPTSGETQSTFYAQYGLH